MRRSKATSTSFRLVGGKGGVGKTTCAAGLAVVAAAAGRRTLVISTDPAPSLGDALGIRLTTVTRRVPSCANLFALEIDSRKALDRWLAPRRAALEDAAVRGTWLDRSDVQSLLRLSLPGIDEIAALLELLAFARAAAFDEIVVDTAPTGHTLRMLALPETLRTVAGAFDDMQAKHRLVVEALRGWPVRDEVDGVIAELWTDAGALRDLLTNRDRTEVVLVSLPEAMAVEETLDALTALESHGMTVSRLVVNRLTGEAPERCGWCSARRRTEAGAIALLQRRLRSARRSGVAIASVGAAAREPVGIRALARVGRQAQDHLNPPAASSRPIPVVRPRIASMPLVSSRERVRLPRVRLLMFGGKGGVGKTTCAAAAALDSASRHQNARMLLVSTDPAHSLADVLGRPLSDIPSPIRGGPRNLHVRELDAQRAWDAVRREYADAIDAGFDRLSNPSFDVAHDRQVMRDLVDLAPPGLDEIAAVLELLDVLPGDGSPGAYDTLVIDTAPTGHALRLLEMPATVHEWVKALMAILLKYQSVVGAGKLGAELVRISRGLTRLRALLRSPDESQFVVVTRPAALPRAEAVRLLRSLRRLGIAVPAVIVNAVGTGSCSRCTRTAAQEQRELTRLAGALTRNRFRLPLIVAPASVPPPTSPAGLGCWRLSWRYARRATQPGVP